MHELSLAESLIGVIEEEARKQGFTRVRRVHLDVGALAGVEIDSLRFGFDIATRGTLAEGAELLINALPGEAWCFTCDRGVVISELYQGCPHCQSHSLQIIGGRQFQLKELEVL